MNFVMVFLRRIPLQGAKFVELSIKLDTKGKQQDIFFNLRIQFYCLVIVCPTLFSAVLQVMIAGKADIKRTDMFLYCAKTKYSRPPGARK